MPGVTPIRFGIAGRGFRWSFTPVEPIVGGIPAQLVEWRAIGALPGQRACGVAAAGSVLVAGVALWDTPAVRASIQGPQVGDEHALDVASYGVFPVTFAAAATRGLSLVAAANGQVTPAAATPDARTVIGFCAQDAVSAGAVGLAYIRPSGG